MPDQKKLSKRLAASFPTLSHRQTFLDDALQQALLELRQSPNILQQPESKQDAWVLTVARRRVYDHLRRENSQQRAIEAYVHLREAAEKKDEPPDELSKSELRETLAEAIAASLSDQEKAVVSLSFGHEMGALTSPLV